MAGNYKHVILTLKLKLETIQRLEEGSSSTNKYNIGETTVHNIWKK
jgi:hypothetical protein